jgi:hypothetical protein
VIDPLLENAKMSIFCTQYLSSEPFHVGIDPDDILRHAKRGYYSFQDYAVQNWFEHLHQCVEFPNGINSVLFGRSIDLARKLLDQYCLERIMDEKNVMANHSQVIEAIQSLPENGRERNSHLNVELPTLLIRRQIAKLGGEDLDSETREMLANLYGQIGSYKCPKPWCELFKGNFGTAEKLKEHVNHHELPFNCPSDGCFAANLGFSSESSLRQHIKDHHAEKNSRILFPVVREEKATSIFSAAARGDLEAVEMALDSGQDVNQPSKPKGSQTPMQLAARNGHVQVCRLLLSRGADYTSYATRAPGLSALDAAADAGSVEVVSMLLQYRPTLGGQHFKSAMIQAAFKGHLDVVRVLFESGMGEMTSSDSWLWQAVHSGNESLVQYLLQNGQERAADEGCLQAALKISAAGPVVRLLLSTGQPTIRQSLTIKRCIDTSQLSLAKMLTSYPKITVDDNGLRECIKKAEEKEGFGEVAGALRALLDTSQRPQHQNTVRQPESI